ncbi:hypothetical protein B9Z55_007561 [Caenorhabditis nigoni]|nr:hypothetical protein B9Z55_007561 [Caenorhabditis nigoni]
MLGTSKTPHNFSTSQIQMLKEFFKEFQFLTEERTSWIKRRIGSDVETRMIHNWFKEQRDLKIQELEKKPGAEKDLPSEMALLHMTYDREPNIKKIKFLSWTRVHQVTETDVRQYYKERTAREANSQQIQNANEPIKQEIEQSPAPIIQHPEEEVKQEIEEIPAPIVPKPGKPIKRKIEQTPAPIIQNPEEEVKQEIDHKFAIPKIRKRRERLPIVSMQPSVPAKKSLASYAPILKIQPPAFPGISQHNLSNIQVLKLKDLFEEFQFLTEDRTARIKKRIGSDVEIQTIHTWFKEQRDRNTQELEKKPEAEKILPNEMALLHMTFDREPNIKKIKFLSWTRVHQVTEAEVRRYYKERTAREEATSFRN